MLKGYSLFEIKSADDETRTLEGIATTPEVDSVGDIVEPKGAEFSLPIPFLWQHDSSQPIGHVTEARVTSKGIYVKVQLAKSEELGALKDRLDEAWQSIKIGLVRGMSVGFRAIEYEFLSDDSFARRFKKWNWLELSAVTIPANAQATITAVKAASRNPDCKIPAGVTAKPRSLALEPTKMTLAERLAALKAKHVETEGKIEAILNEVAKSGVTLDAAQKETVTELEAEADALVDEIELTQRTIDRQAKSAKPVDKPDRGHVEVKDARHIKLSGPKLEPGIAFAREARVTVFAQKHYMNPLDAAAKLYPEDDVVKTAVAAATTTQATWAKPLVQSGGPAADFIEYLRPRTILGRFGTDGIPSLRRVPFRTPLIGQTTPGSAAWVGEGAAKPLTKFDFTPTELLPLKVAAITVATMELLEDSSPSADILLRNQLAEALIARLDVDFINPLKAVSPGVSPASITNGVVPIASSGSDEAAVRRDVQRIFGAFIAANNAPTNGVWIMSSLSALALSLMVGPLGQRSFPEINMNGGTFFGLPVITSEYVQADSDGSYVVLANASDIYFGDEGGIRTAMTTEASLAMADDSSMNSTTPTPAQLVSLFQTNSVGFRVERRLNWAKRRPSAVALLGSVRWGEDTGSGA